MLLADPGAGRAGRAFRPTCALPVGIRLAKRPLVRDATYLCRWMRQSGLTDLLPSLPDTVWVGLSTGSMVMTPRVGEDFVNWRPPTGGDSTLGIVDFSSFPHLGHELMPENTMTEGRDGPPTSEVRRTPSTTRRPSR